MTKYVISLVSLAIIVLGCIAAPASADIKYIGGSPNLSAYISGVNEFSAGSDIVIPVTVRNNGLYDSKQVDPDSVAPDSPPTTVKFVTLNLSSGNAPIVIKSDPQMAGDIPGQGIAVVNFAATVNADAVEGTYMLPVEINYSTLSAYGLYQESSTVKNYYQPDTVTLMVPFVIKSEVIPQVISAVPDNLVAGADGHIDVTVKNIGSLDGVKATITMVQASQSPIIPVDSGVYIGDFPVNSTTTCQFKVSVDKSATHKQYPVSLMVVYQNNEGDFVNSRMVTTGVAVNDKIDFVVTSPLITLRPGSDGAIQVEYKNTGGSTIRGAEARITAGTPFTISASTAYLGDLAPGQSATATYQVSVATDAVTKLYGIDSEVRYRDSLDDIYTSDIMKVPVDVKYPTGIAGILSNTIDLSIIGAAILGIVYSVLHFRKKQ